LQRRNTQKELSEKHFWSNFHHPTITFFGSFKQLNFSHLQEGQNDLKPGSFYYFYG